MMLAEKIAAQTVELAGVSEPRQQKLIERFSAAAASGLAARLRPEVDPETEELLVTAGSLLALADFLETEQREETRRFTVGDVTVENRDSVQAAEHLRRRAEQMTASLCRDSFRFQGV